MKTMKIAGVEYPVLGTVTIKCQPIPLLNIRMMSDERERELSRRKDHHAPVPDYRGSTW